MIEFENFSAYYEHKKENIQALDNLNFHIHRGELLVVVGPSGSGKSTLLKSILGMINTISGELLVDGVRIDDLDVSKSNFAFVQQQATVYPHLTVYENIAFPLRIMRTPQEEVDKRVKEIAAVMDMDWLLNRKPKQLSGGQHQRIAVARAMIKNPDLVLFDEPFSNLDPIARRELRQFVKEIHQQYGCTMVFVTHDLPEAFALADRILVLNEGRIEVVDTPDRLLADPRSDLLADFLGANGSKQMGGILQDEALEK